jgi:pyruvate/2-oxoglutarate dehydrogenase complex dihydrolipoamide dehydrogenase (E3) component
LVIIGGSYVGLEFAQMYRRFGSAVTVIEMQARLIAREDEDVSAAVAEILEHEGIDIRLNAKCLSVARHDQGISVSVDCTAGPPQVVGSHLLLAVGRRPNTDDLGLDKAGVIVDERGYIEVDDQLRTNVPGIWALGDCNGKDAFTHTSYNDFEIVAANLLDNDWRSIADRVPAYALYIDPPLGRAGTTERQVRERSEPALIAKRAMVKVSRAVEKGETQGLASVHSRRRGRRGDPLHSRSHVRPSSPHSLQRAMHIHPTVSELLPTMMGELKPLAPSLSDDRLGAQPNSRDAP